MADEKQQQIEQSDEKATDAINDKQQSNQPKEPKKKRKLKTKKNEPASATIDEKVIENFDLVYKNKLKYAIFKLNDDETNVIVDTIADDDCILE